MYKTELVNVIIIRRRRRRRRRRNSRALQLMTRIMNGLLHQKSMAQSNFGLNRLNTRHTLREAETELNHFCSEQINVKRNIIRHEILTNHNPPPPNTEDFCDIVVI
jgi:hypothetical protein